MDISKEMLLLNALIHFLLIPLVSASLPLLPLPRLLPIRYDVQLQLPTASDQDPLVPTFFGSARIEFQLTRNLPSPTDIPVEMDGIIRLTFLAQQLDQFLNVSLAQSGREEDEAMPVTVELKPPREVDFLVQLEGAQNTLMAGRYTLDIGRFQGVITYGKGVFYRDAGGLPLLASDFFFGNAPSLFPQLGGPLQKTTTKLSLIHPQGSIALGSMQPLGPTESLNEHWRLTRFVQAPNVAAYLLALAVLPDSVFERTVVQSQPPLFLWTNRLLHAPTLKQELARLVGPVFEAVSNLLGGEQLPLSAINVLVVDEFNGTHSFGLIPISLRHWESSDEAHRIALLARHFLRQWLGGMVTASSSSMFCLQEDIVQWLSGKTVKRVLSGRPADDRAWERYQLAQYLRLLLAETFLAPGESVALPDWADSNEIESHCALKGAQLLHSLELLTNEDTLLTVVRRLLSQQRYRNFRLEHFTELLRPLVVDNIDLGQVFDFWFRSGGIPNLLVEKREDRLRLLQLNEGREAQTNAAHWGKMPLWPLPMAVRNVSLPFRFMLSQVLELAPLDRKLLPLANLGFEHLYRVNYDADSWERIVRELDATTLSTLSARARAQLLGDFCYFEAVEQIGPAGERLQRQWLALLREHFEHFELCEFYAFWCMAGSGKRIPMDRTSRAKYTEVLEQRVWPALRNGANYECGGPGAGFDAGNELCRAAFDRNCF